MLKSNFKWPKGDNKLHSTLLICKATSLYSCYGFFRRTSLFSRHRFFREFRPIKCFLQFNQQNDWDEKTIFVIFWWHSIFLFFSPFFFHTLTNIRPYKAETLISGEPLLQNNFNNKLVCEITVTNLGESGSCSLPFHVSGNLTNHFNEPTISLKVFFSRTYKNFTYV